MRFRAVLFAIILTVSPVLVTPSSAQVANHVVISEVYGGGGNSGATLKNDFIELYNPTDSPVDISGWSVQYASATGTSWQVTALTGSIAPHRYCLVQEAQGTGGTLNLPTPDVTGTLAMGGTNGKVALVNSATALSGANPSSSLYVDLLGYGTANGYEGSASAPALSNTTSAERKANSSSTASSLASSGADEALGNGYDTDNNSADFVAQSAINPQNSASLAEPVNTIPGSGIGSALIAPSIVSAASTSNFTIEFISSGTDIIDTVIVVVPSKFSWSKSRPDVSVSGTGTAGAHVDVVQDTIHVGGLAVTNADSAAIVLHLVTVPDSAMAGMFVVKTAIAGVEPSPVSSQLVVTVTKLVRIIDLHINDSQGVPTAPYQVGALVTVSGIITSDGNLIRTDLYLQDATAGVNIFSYSRSYDYQVGDSVTFTGTIQQYRGTTEIAPDSAKTIFHAHGKPLPAPLLLTAADVNQTFTDDYSEPNEGRLVRINGVTYSAANTTISDITGTTGGFIPDTWTIPAGTFDLIGILKQYKPGTASLLTPPYTSDYEVVARTQDDIIGHAGPSFTKAPTEEDIQPNSVTVSFKTGSFSTAVVRFGTTETYTDSVVQATADSTHEAVIDGLWPATVYHYQIAATDAEGTNQTGDAIFSTASPDGSTGTIDVFFSKSVDTSVARNEKARTVDISSKFISRINAAQHSIDVALYSLSGTVGANVATALINAKNRGVKIRMIVEDDNSGTAPMNTMKSSGIPFITDTYDPVNAGNGLMHNKFAVFDFRDTASFTDDWVWSGSWNATDPGNNSDAQNALEIQDKALANAYTMEFNEMWGSSTDTPNASQSRFGIRKTDNTPHRFNIGGNLMESYFSPSDQTTLHIYKTLNAATSSINICMLTFTRSDLAQALITAKTAGDKVRVILDNNTDSGNQFSALQAGNVDIHLKGSSLTGLLHHKYALIDAENAKADETVITGSHNWSNAAETSNNENTLIIHDARVANLYLQEFKARYIEAGGSDAIVLGVKRTGDGIPTAFGLGQNYPNPFNPTTAISYQLSAAGRVSLKVYDILGREVMTLIDRNQNPGYYCVTFDAARFASGTYFYVLKSGVNLSVKKMLLLK